MCEYNLSCTSPWWHGLLLCASIFSPNIYNLSCTSARWNGLPLCASIFSPKRLTKFLALIIELLSSKGADMRRIACHKKSCFFSNHMILVVPYFLFSCSLSGNIQVISIHISVCNSSFSPQVTDALAQAGLESSNLIVGIDFTKSNEWTGSGFIQTNKFS